MDRVLSPQRGTGAATPDSLFSEGSRGGGGVLNLRVSGPTPKAYSREEKAAARKRWMKAKPEWIESASEASDSEFGSRSVSVCSRSFIFCFVLSHVRYHFSVYPVVSVRFYGCFVSLKVFSSVYNQRPTCIIGFLCDKCICMYMYL